MDKMKTIKEQVYEVVKKEILDGKYKPGERIHELQIAKRLEVSRSPVREAIKELIGEGLLVSVPNKSITVKKLSVKEINEIFEFRNITEKYAIEKTIGNLDGRIERKLNTIKRDLKKNYDAGNLRQYCGIDSELHRFLIEASGNELLVKVVGNAMALIEQFRIISLSSQQRLKESVDEHIAMIDHILKKDADAAWRTCSSHLELARQAIVSYLSREK
jgi:DNA-binding GntR family transcriptional regulator